MRLTAMSVQTLGDAVRLSAHVESGRAPASFDLYFEYPAEFAAFVSDSPDPFAVAMLVPAMIRGEALEIIPPISPRLHFELPRVRDIFRAWHPDYTRSEIRTTARSSDLPDRGCHAATCFSGGVDSFYTLLKYRSGYETLPSPLTHVLFMRGLEKPLDFLRGVEEAQALVQKIANAAGVRLIVGESNLRAYFDADWLHVYCGSGLAAAALSLGGGCSHVCIPSTYSYRDPVPIGSTPLVDERFSTERVQIVHDGADLPRAEKLARILEWNPDLVLQNLRVCVMNFGGAYNCCECHKCIRTMIPLRALGMLDRAVTFPNKSMAHWPDIIRWDSLPFVEENLAFAQAHNGDPALTNLLEQIVVQRRRKEAFKAALVNSPLYGVVPAIQSTRRGLHGIRKRLRTQGQG
jgi:hypothetical protein